MFALRRTFVRAPGRAVPLPSSSPIPLRRSHREAEPTEAERVFQALAENGTVRMPIQTTFWAARFGMLVDQFGTPWMINCAQAA